MGLQAYDAAMEDMPLSAIALAYALMGCPADVVADVARKADEAERRMLADPNYRIGDPAVHPDDRLGL